MPNPASCTIGANITTHADRGCAPRCHPAATRQHQQSRGVCRFLQADCLDDEAAVLQLLRDRRANKALVDIGGNRAAPALAAVLSAIQRAGVQWIYVKCESMFEASLEHLRRVEAAAAGSGEWHADMWRHQGAAAGAGAAECRDERKSGSEAARAQQNGATGCAVQSQQARSSDQEQTRESDTQRVLWRWRKQAMPRAWDLHATAAVRAEGLVRETLAVVMQPDAWWGAQVCTRCRECVGRASLLWRMCGVYAAQQATSTSRSASERPKRSACRWTRHGRIE